MTTTAVELLPELLKKISLNSYDPGHSYWVDVTHINNPLSFYVRPTVYRRFMNEIQAHEHSLKPEAVQVQSVVVYLSQTLNKLIRGLVINIENNEQSTTCNMFASDYGFFDKSVEMKDIFKPKMCNVPPLAMHCQLADCKPIGDNWSGKEIDAMKCYVGEERARLFVREKSPEILTVELINSLPDDIATMLALTGYSTMGYEDNEISRLSTIECKKLYFTYKDLKPNDVLHVRLQTGKELNEFYVADKKDYSSFLNERENYTYFTKQLKELTIEDFVVGKPVGVFMYSTYKYERGIIKEILSDSRARVQLIDWGNIIEEHISSLKPMSDKFYHYPAVALYCSAEQNQLTEPALQKYLYPGYEFRIEVLEVGKEFSEPHIVKLLPL